MKFLLLLPILFAATLAQTPPAKSGPPVEVLEFRWSQARQNVDTKKPEIITPAPAMIPENKNFQRKAREQLSPGMIDPNEQTIDGRSAAMERNVQTARQPVKDPIEGFLYHASFRNTAAAKIDLIFWEYRFAEPADRSNFSRRQFLCVARIKPGDRGDVEAFSIFGPTDTIAAGTPGKTEGRFIEDVVINRIEFSNGAVLQRSDWDYKASKDAIDRITKTAWAGGTCRLF